MGLKEDHKRIAWCPKCGDSMEHKQETLKQGEQWTYYCFGCDKNYIFKELQEEYLLKQGVDTR